ncbi:MAG TPA: hypothetical protein PLH84_16115 [Candidatus Krumholzibacteria bacterium]|nr:hypothetical protein [Candidatus Krumholzibacteria bacterium]
MNPRSAWLVVLLSLLVATTASGKGRVLSGSGSLKRPLAWFGCLPAGLFTQDLTEDFIADGSDITLRIWGATDSYDVFGFGPYDDPGGGGFSLRDIMIVHASVWDTAAVMVYPPFPGTCINGGPDWPLYLLDADALAPEQVVFGPRNTSNGTWVQNYGCVTGPAEVSSRSDIPPSFCEAELHITGLVPGERYYCYYFWSTSTVDIEDWNSFFEQLDQFPFLRVTVHGSDAPVPGLALDPVTLDDRGRYLPSRRRPATLPDR